MRLGQSFGIQRVFAWADQNSYRLKEGRSSCNVIRKIANGDQEAGCEARSQTSQRNPHVHPSGCLINVLLFSLLSLFSLFSLIYRSSLGCRPTLVHLGHDNTKARRIAFSALRRRQRSLTFSKLCLDSQLRIWILMGLFICDGHSTTVVHSDDHMRNYKHPYAPAPQTLVNILRAFAPISSCAVPQLARFCSACTACSFF